MLNLFRQVGNTKLKIIAGLGNPGEKYKYTRHNIGFMVVSEFAERFGIDGRMENKFNAVVGKGNVNSQEVLIVQPMTFMNLSGESVIKILNWYKVDPSDFIVVFDDIALDLGRMRFRSSGSDGGHNGIKSIIQHFGGKDKFDRLKVGIGPDPGGALRKQFVLEKFSSSEKDVLNRLVKAGSDALELYLQEGLSSASNKFNGYDARLV